MKVKTFKIRQLTKNNANITFSRICEKFSFVNWSHYFLANGVEENSFVATFKTKNINLLVFFIRLTEFVANRKYITFTNILNKNKIYLKCNLFLHFIWKFGKNNNKLNIKPLVCNFNIPEGLKVEVLQKCPAIFLCIYIKIIKVT